MIAWLTLIPLVATALVLLTPANQMRAIRWIAATATLLTLGLAIYIVWHFDRGNGGYQFEIRRPWLSELGISYHAGADGISCVVILLHAICSFAATFVSFSIRERVKEYFAFLLILIASIFGVFTSLDLFFMYLFYEMAVIPMYPLIGIWGSKQKEFASMKLTLYITGGAVIAFVGLLALYHAAGLHSFDLPEIKAALTRTPLPLTFQVWCAPLFIFGFGVIASLWPFHSWSPIGYAAAPSAVSMLHAGVLKKIGIYLVIRIVLDLVPDGARVWLPLVAVLAVVNVLYGAWTAMTQKDLKFVIGFASVSHMGYALLGVSAFNPLALTGTVFFIFAHGIMAALCFALIGYIYDQTHTRMIPELGGLAHHIPFISFCFVMAALASSGLPGFGNFISEILIFFGSWKTFGWQTGCAIFGIVVTATYMLRLIRDVFFGVKTARWAGLKDAPTGLEKLPFVLLLSALLVTGFWPASLTELIRPSADLLTGIKPAYLAAETLNQKTASNHDAI